MRKPTCMFLVVLMLAGLGLLGTVGCGGGTKTTYENERAETVPGKSGTTVPDEVPLVSIPTEAELGMPIYPAAKMDTNALLRSETTIVAKLWTTDPTDKVIAWYKEKLAGKPEYKELPIVEGGKNEIIITWKDGKLVKNVTIGESPVGDHPGTTSIGLGSMPGQ